MSDERLRIETFSKGDFDFDEYNRMKREHQNALYRRYADDAASQGFIEAAEDALKMIVPPVSPEIRRDVLNTARRNSHLRFKPRS